MKTISRLGAICGVAVLALSAAQGADGVYVWPLKGRESLSSLFADYRPGRHHGGVDVRTDGTIGFPVLAADTGYVWRVTTGYWGYGKAVYVKLQDGRVAVYGHLDDFAKPIRDFVLDNQYDAEQYKTNLFPAPGQLPVGRGEVIGNSGQTGGVPPHLHFEIRSVDNRPLNPIKHGFQVTDKRAPQVNALIFEPFLADFNGKSLPTVDGSPLSRKLSVSRLKDGSYKLDSLPVITGPVGLAVDAVDFVNNDDFGGPPYHYRLFVNGAPFYEMALDSFDYENSSQIVLERVIVGTDKPRAVRLYRIPGNDMVRTQSIGASGLFQLSDLADSPLKIGHNTFRIELEDAGDNRTILDGDLIMAQPLAVDSAFLVHSNGVSQLAIFRSGDNPRNVKWELTGRSGAGDWTKIGSGAITLDASLSTILVGDQLPARDHWRLILTEEYKKGYGLPHWFNVDIRPSLSPAEAVEHFAPEIAWHPVMGGMVGTWREGRASTIRVWSKNDNSRELPVTSRWDGSCAVYVDGSIDIDTVLWFELTSSRMPQQPRPISIPFHNIGKLVGGAIQSSDSLAQVVFQPGDVYSSLGASINTTGRPRKSAKPLSSVYSFEPRYTPLRRPARIGISTRGLPALPENLAIFRLTEDGEWEYVGSDYDKEHDVMEARVPMLGDFALLEDDQPPVIRDVRPGKGSRIRDTRPEITFEMWDELAGFGSERDLTMTIEDRWLPVDYDPRLKKGSARPRWDLPPGEHMVVITARDRLGNEDRYRRLLRIVR